MFLGAIFHKGDEDLQKIFQRAISDTKYENFASAFKLVAAIEYVDANTDSFKTAKAGKFVNKKNPIVPNDDYAILSTNLIFNNSKYEVFSSTFLF